MDMIQDFMNWAENQPDKRGGWGMLIMLTIAVTVLILMIALSMAFVIVVGSVVGFLGANGVCIVLICLWGGALGYTLWTYKTDKGKQSD